jgi:hypothetical protein
MLRQYPRLHPLLNRRSKRALPHPLSFRRVPCTAAANDQAVLLPGLMIVASMAAGDAAHPVPTGSPHPPGPAPTAGSSGRGP